MMLLYLHSHMHEGAHGSLYSELSQCCCTLHNKHQYFSEIMRCCDSIMMCVICCKGFICIYKALQMYTCSALSKMMWLRTFTRFLGIDVHYRNKRPHSIGITFSNTSRIIFEVCKHDSERHGDPHATRYSKLFV